MVNEQRMELLCRDVARILDREVADPNTPILSISIDSLNLVEVLIVCEQLYSVEIDVGDLEVDDKTTIRQLCAQLETLPKVDTLL